MFGHAFLKFDSDDDLPSNGLMAFTIGFAADTSSYQGTLDYLYRGLAGGFPADNTLKRYYRMLRQYADLEKRDVWEFPLQLTEQERERLVLHLWELNEPGLFNYYFLDENCAYRIIALLDVVKPDLKLREKFKAYTIPAEAIRALGEGGVTGDPVYRPSALKTFRSHTQALSDEERSWVEEVVVKETRLDERRLHTLSSDRAPKVLAAASEYLALLIDGDSLDRKKSAELERELLSQRLKLQSPISWEPAPRPPAPPGSGHGEHRLSAGAGGSSSGDFVSLGYRQLYHGLSDPLDGFEKGLEIELLNAELRRYGNGGIRLQKADLLNVANYAPMDVFFRPLSWRYAVGREEREMDRRRAVGYLEGEWGGTFTAGPMMFPALLKMSLENSTIYRGNYGGDLGIMTEALYQGDIVTSRSALEWGTLLPSKITTYFTASQEFGFSLSKNLSLLLLISTSRYTKEFRYDDSISLRYYF